MRKSMDLYLVAFLVVSWLSVSGPAIAQDLNQQGEIHAERFKLKVHRHPKCPRSDAELHARLADRLAAARIDPSPARIDYFRSHYVQNSPEVTGWFGYVVGTRPTVDGLLVTLEVGAQHSMYADNLRIHEQYLVTDSGVSLVDWSPLPNKKRIIIGF